jgi:hypothetical protein
MDVCVVLLTSPYTRPPNENAPMTDSTRALPTRRHLAAVVTWLVDAHQ